MLVFNVRSVDTGAVRNLTIRHVDGVGQSSSNDIRNEDGIGELLSRERVLRINLAVLKMFYNYCCRS